VIRHVFVYEPSRSARGVATAMVDAAQGIPAQAIVQQALDTLDEGCREAHDFGLPSLDPADYRVSHRANEEICDPRDPRVTMLARHRIELRA
jgi:hypothetical protein